MFHVCLFYAVLSTSITCNLVMTCWERADLLALLCVVFSCVLSCSHMWHLITLIPDLCRPLFFKPLKYVHSCLTAGLVNPPHSDGVPHTY